MQHIPAIGPTIKGIDVSHWQLKVHFAQVVAAGYEFAFIKATDGIAGIDPMFKIHWANARAAKMKRMGAYHFFHPSQDPVLQAKHFLSNVPDFKAGDELALDLERTDNLPAAIDHQRVIAFMQTVQAQTGVLPYLYSGPYFMQAIGNYQDLLQYKLWLAHYGPSAQVGPLVPPPWPTWTIWQFTSKAIVPGVVGLCDCSYFNGQL